tara:strand:+ start:6922 stop:9198 length:2277 start_codon:yes stop_codon:yes gene_type:complete
MAKINTKTFNPMSGVSLPGWALQSYQTTSADLADVVDSLTNAYNLQQKREQEMATDAARMAQQDRVFAQRDRDFQYKKDRDDFLDAKSNFESATSELTGSAADNAVFDTLLRSVPATDNPRLTEYYDSQREIHKRRVQDRNNVRENLRNTFLDGLPDENLSKEDEIKLDSWTMQYFKDPTGWAKNMTEHTFKQLYPEYNPDFLKKQTTTAVFDALALDVMPTLVRSVPGSAKYEEAREKWEAALGLLGTQQGSGTNFSMDIDVDSKYARDSGISPSEIVTRRAEDPEGLTEEINNFYKKDEEKDEGYLEGIGDFISDKVEGIGEAISESGVGTIGRYLNRQDSPLGTITRFLAREDTDLTEELDKGIGILGEEIAEGWKGIKEGVPALAEAAIEGFKELPDIAQETYSDFTSNHPNISSGLGKIGTIAAAVNPITSVMAYAKSSPEQKDKVKQFAIDSYNKVEPIVKDMTYLALDKADDVMTAGLEYATEKFTGGIKAIHEARAPKMALKRGMEVMSTLPHRAIEFFNFNRNPDIDKYVEGGMSWDDAYDQAMKDAVARGGEYYTRSAWKVGEDAPAKHIYKKKLVDYASNKNLWMIERGPFKKGGSDMPENMKNAPAKFVNPRWIAWQTNNLEKDLYAQYAKITDAKNQSPALAAKSMMSVKNESSKLIKELRKIKSDIVNAPKISKGEMSVSPKVIDELINRAQRLTASKSALNSWDNFMKGAQFDFDYEKELNLNVDNIVKELEFEGLLDSLRAN